MDAAAGAAGWTAGREEPCFRLPLAPDEVGVWRCSSPDRLPPQAAGKTVQPTVRNGDTEERLRSCWDLSAAFHLEDAEGESSAVTFLPLPPPQGL